MTEKKEERGGGEGVVAPHTHVCTHVAHLPKEGEGEQGSSGLHPVHLSCLLICQDFLG